MKDLPNHVQKYSTSPLFTEDTVPEGLLKDHNTKGGVWGLICVTKGELEYVIKGKERLVLRSGKRGVIGPEVKHYVRPLGNVSFYVEFYK